MTDMKFEQFQQNVQGWAAARGIYEHSTPLAQALKAVSEVGELADAVIKGDRDALKDAIGDVAVCLVNWAYMTQTRLLGGGEPAQTVGRHVSAQLSATDVALFVAQVAFKTGYKQQADTAVNTAMLCLLVLARNSGLTFEECCQAAWDEIKDRTGRMVAGGAFVKDEPV